MNWWAVDRIEGRVAVLVPAWFETWDAAHVEIRATRAMREGQVYRWNGRKLSRDRAYERRAAAAARSITRQDAGGRIVL